MIDRWASLALVCLLGAALPCAAERLVWHSGFEAGFPGGEWLDYDNGSYSPRGTMPSGRVSAWTIIERGNGEPVLTGRHAYKGWIVGAAKESHRPYPVLHADIPTPLVNSFAVYVDADFARMSRGWGIHLGTWGNHDAQAQRGVWALHTMAVREGRLEFAHVAPFHGEYIGPTPPPAFPLRRWVRLTVYLLYEGDSGFVQAWQDGLPMLRAGIPKLKEYPGTRLRTAHWGMYASAELDHGVQYNDDISICTLKAPLIDLAREPRCPPPRR